MSEARRIPVDGVDLMTLGPGDYCGPLRGYTGDKPAVFFLPPGLSLEGRPGWLCHVCSPPHTFRECDDGSLEIRASIGVIGKVGQPYLWHGYLDEGNVWREC